MGITKKQKEVFDYICHYQEREGVAPTQKEIKDHFGFKSFGSVQRYIRYLEDANFLETSWNARRGLAITNDANSTCDSNIVEIPLLGDVAAGNPIEAIENSDDLVSIPTTMLKQNYRHFALRVKGDSMIDLGIFDRDLVVCRSQQQAQQGEIVVAALDGEATVKTFYKKKSHIELHPANDSYEPITISEDSGEFAILGVLVGLIRSYN